MTGACITRGKTEAKLLPSVTISTYSSALFIPCKVYTIFEKYWHVTCPCENKICLRLQSWIKAAKKLQMTLDVSSASFYHFTHSIYRVWITVSIRPSDKFREATSCHFIKCIMQLYKRATLTAYRLWSNLIMSWWALKQNLSFRISLILRATYLVIPTCQFLSQLLKCGQVTFKSRIT